MDLKLRGRTALVTGSSKGIGAAVARALAAEGCNVWLAARSAELLEKNAEAIRKEFGVEAHVMALDLADQAERERLVAAAPDIDILVNNAGDLPGGTLDQVDDARWRAGWDLKIFGYINLSRAYYARMRARRKGVIINIAGIGGERVDAGYIAGSTGNAVVMAFSRALGGSSLNDGVRVLCINPGAVATERMERLARVRAERVHGDPERWAESNKNFPGGRAALPEEIGSAAAFLASDLSAYTSGCIVTIDGGASSTFAIS
jgi:NAD(P)-dependent dehydrogenase (short-subunit alcohol dehydrogenase family)